MDIFGFGNTAVFAAMLFITVLGASVSNRVDSIIDDRRRKDGGLNDER